VTDGTRWPPTMRDALAELVEFIGPHELAPVGDTFGRCCNQQSRRCDSGSNLIPALPAAWLTTPARSEINVGGGGGRGAGGEGGILPAVSAAAGDMKSGRDVSRPKTFLPAASTRVSRRIVVMSERGGGGGRAMFPKDVGVMPA